MSGKSLELRTKIHSVQNTRKITRAMEMVAASKMRRAQQRMRRSQPYAEHIRRVIYHLTHAHPEYRHHYMHVREPQRIGYWIVSTDRGLCGGLNANLFRSVLMDMEQHRAAGREVVVSVIGRRAEAFFRRAGFSVEAQAVGLGDEPELMDLIGVVRVFLQAYTDQSLDRICLASNRFVSTMVQKPTIQTLLPLAEFQKEQHTVDVNSAALWDYLYEPDPKTLLDVVLTRFIESQVYQAVVDNVACEQASRMLAMRSASDNADQLIQELRLVYNKARQAAITTEINEIVGGSQAV